MDNLKEIEKILDNCESLHQALSIAYKLLAECEKLQKENNDTKEA